MGRALVWFNLNGCEAVWRKPHDHIGRVTPMPFASINSTNQRTNPWRSIFCLFLSRKLAELENEFFLVGHFDFFFNFFFCFFQWKQPWFSYEVSFFEILMITLVSSQKSLPPNISAGSVKAKVIFIGKNKIKIEKKIIETHSGLAWVLACWAV